MTVSRYAGEPAEPAMLVDASALSRPPKRAALFHETTSPRQTRKRDRPIAGDCPRRSHVAALA